METQPTSPVIADAVQTVELAIVRTNLRRLSQTAGVNYHTLRTLHKHGLAQARQIKMLSEMHAAALEILKEVAA